ncbi:MAG: hypothetical protein K0R98_1570 [Rickettsiaceae bacterium]|jgi:predicted secreted protein|nr:hypothetical protein [Rickettsiaceae bacterium]
MFSVVVVYVVVWWLVFFMALPIGIRHDENPQVGIKAAPSNPNLKIKIIATSIITLILTAIYFYLMQNGYFDFINVRSEIQI